MRCKNIYNPSVETKAIDLIIAMLKGSSNQIENVRAEIRQLDKDINLLKAQVNELKTHDVIQKSPHEIKKLRVRDYAAGTSIGAAAVAFIEWLRTYFS